MKAALREGLPLKNLIAFVYLNWRRFVLSFVSSSVRKHDGQIHTHMFTRSFNDNYGHSAHGRRRNYHRNVTARNESYSMR